MFLLLVSHVEDSPFHFLPNGASSNSSSHHSINSLCYEVPALLGLGAGSKPISGAASGISSRHGRPSSNSNGGGFYKRLLEWLSRKKKSHRRYSEVVLPENCPMDPNCRQSLHSLMAITPSSRNQSAPMIFDVHRPSPAGVKIEVRPAPVQEQPAEEFCIVPLSFPSSNALPTTPTTPTFFSEEGSSKGNDEIDAEWIIPWSDIQVGPVISRRGTCTINR